MKNIYLLLISLMTTFYGFSQKTINGTVSDDQGPLPGATIIIQGSSTGVTTDFDGNYSIEASEGDVLEFSYIGMEGQTVTVGSQDTIDVIMTSSTELQEVIVTGYGTSSREKFTGAVAVISAETLEMQPSATFQSALQGAAPGLQVVSNDGAPGAGISIRVRGIGSISSSNEPLYVIDGMPITSGSLSTTDFSNGGRSSNVLGSINPNDIESLVVLKDAASTAIYGSRGANGVVLITTKSGKTGDPKFTLRARYGTQEFAYDGILRGLNSEQYKQLHFEGYINRGTSADAARELFANQFPLNDAGQNYNTIWLDEMTQTGIVQEYDFSFSGGSEKVTYFGSANYFDNDGMVKNNKFERFSSRLNIDAQLTDRFKISNNVNISTFDQRGITDGTRWQAPFYLAYLMAPTVPVYDQFGRFYGDHKNFFMGGNNPVGHLYDDKRELSQMRLTDVFEVSYEIMDGLTIKSDWSFDLLKVDEYLFQNGRYGDGRRIGGYANEGGISQTNWLGTQSIQFTPRDTGNHNMNFFAAYEAQKVMTRTIELTGEGFSHPDLKFAASAANPTQAYSARSDYAFQSYFARANYDYNSEYFVSMSFRRDGSSRFGPDQRWGTFGSIGVGWNMTRLIESVPVIDFLKLRGSFGTTGNAGIGNFDWAGLWGFTRDYDGNPGAAPSQVSNNLLTWESQENFNIGIDATFLNNKITLNAEYFERMSSDLLLDRPLSLTTGFTSVAQNIGDMKNSGIEIDLGIDIIQTSEAFLGVNFNTTTLKNEITYLPEPIVVSTKKREQGRDFQEYFLFPWAGVDPANGDPLWYLVNADGTINYNSTTNRVGETERVYMEGKSATPDFYGGFNLNASYKSFSLGMTFNYSFGNYLYFNPGWVIHGDGRFTPRSTTTYAFNNRWTTPGQVAEFPKHRWGGNQSSNQRPNSRYLYEGDYVRLKSLNLSYDVPTDLFGNIGINQFKVYLDMNNIWTWTKADNLPFDPDQAIDGIYNTMTPLSKTTSLGVTIGF